MEDHLKAVAEKRVRQLLAEGYSDSEVIEQLSVYGRRLVSNTLLAVKAEVAAQ
jgi:hypothetical protein